jgi:hypothetical protein
MNEFQARWDCSTSNISSVKSKSAAGLPRATAKILQDRRVVVPSESRRHSAELRILPVTFDPSVRPHAGRVDKTLNSYGVFARKYFYPLPSEAACYQGRFRPGNAVALAPQARADAAMYRTLRLTTLTTSAKSSPPADNSGFGNTRRRLQQKKSFCRFSGEQKDLFDFCGIRNLRRQPLLLDEPDRR